MLEAVEARIRAERDRLDDADMVLLAEALRSPAASPPLVVEHLGPWRWRVTLNAWEAHGVTRRAALRRFRLRYGLSAHVRPDVVDWSKEER